MNGEKTFQSLRTVPMSKLSAWLICPVFLWTCLGGSFTSNVRAGEAPPLQLLSVAPVSGDGIFLPQVFTSAQPLKVCESRVKCEKKKTRD